ncbi:MAG: alanine--tRNA ligase [Actinobacteria bacterium]|nr:MAG: alanine--tRNA ligase [Actinomycetota bacterium]
MAGARRARLWRRARPDRVSHGRRDGRRPRHHRGLAPQPRLRPVKVSEIREAYLSFFEQRGHLRVPSGSLIPAPEDTSTLLTIAGMQPFKPYFRGDEQPPSNRLTSCQKVFRTPDIDEVGNTLRHLTFFEMLGNWSFGDYFKDQSIAWGLELSIEVFGLERESIWATVFGGDDELGLGPDEESIEIWKRRGIPEERIVLLPRSENFWQAGETGPCGPCSEMYLDRGPEFGGADERPGDDTDRFLEYWNHVFMSYELHEDGSLTKLPANNVDTGMGLERMAVVLQGVESVFQTDSFQPLIDLAQEMSGRSYGDDHATTRAMRIIADHSRGMTFLIADGVVPSNEDRGYVLRRVMRRAIQQGRVLELESPWLERFAERTIEMMGDAYPELVSERDTIMRWVGDEETAFGRTLDRGTQLLEQLIAEAKEQGTSWIDAGDAFKLHDTYGFPYDLTKELLAEQGLSVDDAGFEALMEKQRIQARTGAEPAVQDRHGAVMSFAQAAPPSTFVGYETLSAVTAVAAADSPLLKLEESPFYPEGGGQVSDSGSVTWDGQAARVADVYRLGDDQVIRLDDSGSAPEPGSRVRAEVDHETRHATMRNHTATHLLHAALRERLGTHVRQAGSAVRPDKLRFDFTHGAALAPEEVRDVEDRVNEWIKASRPVRALHMSRGEAEALGAMARLGARDRGRRGLARALRRHARCEHRGDRDLRDRLRGVKRRERAAGRGDHRTRRDRLVPRAKRCADAGRDGPRLAARAFAGGGARRGAFEGARAACRRGRAAKRRRGGGRTRLDRCRHRRPQGRDGPARRRGPARVAQSCGPSQGQAGRGRRRSGRRQ